MVKTRIRARKTVKKSAPPAPPPPPEDATPPRQDAAPHPQDGTPRAHIQTATPDVDSQIKLEPRDETQADRGSYFGFGQDPEFGELCADEPQAEYVLSPRWAAARLTVTSNSAKNDEEEVDEVKAELPSPVFPHQVEPPTPVVKHEPPSPVRVNHEPASPTVPESGVERLRAQLRNARAAVEHARGETTRSRQEATRSREEAEEARQDAADTALAEAERQRDQAALAQLEAEVSRQDAALKEMVTKQLRGIKRGREDDEAADDDAGREGKRARTEG
ncbi:hypothetical protein AURDEDRAFT_121953 [Auricularia subglabra TFB-10046 SS5]|nr:hypothetical protein AURDEDRAFT_121953 [Auricularia subglabra TFB-10046 SS5]